MEDQEILDTQERLAKLFEDIMKEYYKCGKNKGRRFVDFIEKPTYLAAMRYCSGNQTRAEQYLGVSTSKIRNVLLRHFKTTSVGSGFKEIN